MKLNRIKYTAGGKFDKSFAECWQMRQQMDRGDRFQTWKKDVKENWGIIQEK